MGVPDVVHVALECTTTLRYEPRPIGLLGKRLFDHTRWPLLTVLDPPRDLEPMALEHQLRRQLPAAATSHGCLSDDLVVIGDVDEIPSAGQLAHAAALALDAPGPVTLVCDYRQLKADWRAPDEWQPANQAYVARRETITDAQALREFNRGGLTVSEIGWHLSSLGGPASVARKLATFAHHELRPEYQDQLWLEYCTREGNDLLGRFRLEPVERRPGLLPDCVLEQDRFKHLLRETT